MFHGRMAFHQTLLGLLFWSAFLWNICSCQTEEELKVLDEFLHKRYYDKRSPPSNDTGDCTNVTLQLGMSSIWSLSSRSMDFEADLYMKMQWIDQRLKTNESSLPTKTSIVSHPDIVHKIWRPEIYFPNAKSGQFQNIMVPNHQVTIHFSNGSVEYLTRYIMKFSCVLDLRKYPLDTQKCTIEISIIGKLSSSLNLLWNSKQPLKLHQKVSLPNFLIDEHNIGICDEHYNLDNYSCLEAELVLKRLLGYHFVQIFIPTILIVVISWVSFWMDVDAVPGRTTLGITTLLTVTSKSTGVQSRLPEVSYVKAIDVWMGVCTAFVFGALCEFVFANYHWRRQPRNGENFTVISPSDGCEKSSKVEAEVTIQTRMRRNRSDELARVLFPLTFLIFNAIYWVYYLFLF